MPGNYIAANDRGTVEIWYGVVHSAGGDDESIRLTLEIGEQPGEPGDVDPPEIEGVQNGVLNLESVPRDGALATVMQYPSMREYDVVYFSIRTDVIEWEDGVPIDELQVGKPVEMTIPRFELERVSGREVKLKTVVIHTVGGDRIESAASPIRILAPVGDLPEVDVPLADGESLDPEQVTGPSVQVVVKPYTGVAVGDVITFTWTNASGAPAPFVGTQTADDPPQHDYVFEVPSAHVDQNVDKAATLSYTVARGAAQPKPSASLTLYIGEAFEAAATLDATGKHYILAEKPPLAVPEYGTLLREAKFGAGPYVYRSSDETVASVDAAGRVTARGNGTATITATDSGNQSRSYPITVAGVVQLFFVTASANFAGAQAACASANLRVPTLDEMKAFWAGYYPSVGRVAAYMEWLSYPFWTGTTQGAGLAYAYDLNGDSEQGNVIGRNEADFMQVVGIFP